MISPRRLPRTGFRIAWFGGSMAAGSNIFIRMVRPKLTTAAPATQRQRRDNSRPFGKTNAIATGQANSSGIVARSDWSDHPRAEELLRAELEGRHERPEQEYPGDGVARLLDRDQQADDRRGE